MGGGDVTNFTCLGGYNKFWLKLPQIHFLSPPSLPVINDQSLTPGYRCVEVNKAQTAGDKPESDLILGGG